MLEEQVYATWMLAKDLPNRSILACPQWTRDLWVVVNSPGTAYNGKAVLGYNRNNGSINTSGIEVHRPRGARPCHKFKIINR